MRSVIAFLRHNTQGGFIKNVGRSKKTHSSKMKIATSIALLLAAPVLGSFKDLEIQSSSADGSEELCDMTLPGSVCLFDGKKVLMPD